MAATNVRAEAGSSLAKAYTRKMRDTEAACRQPGLVFFPVALETLKGLHTVAVAQVKQLGTALARQTGLEVINKRLPVSSSNAFHSSSCEAMLH